MSPLSFASVLYRSFYVLHLWSDIAINRCLIIDNVADKKDLTSMPLSELIEAALAAADHANVQMKKVLDYIPHADGEEQLEYTFSAKDTKKETSDCCLGCKDETKDLESRDDNQIGVRQPQGPFEMMIPGNLVSRIIGKTGEVINSLRKETGAIINIIQDSPEIAKEKLLRICGKPEYVASAKKRVEQILWALGLNMSVITSKNILGASGTPSHVHPPTTSLSPDQTENNPQ